MSLPTEWVNKIFKELAVKYGRDFAARWEGMELEKIKADWAHELSGFEAHPDALGYALKNLPPDRPPTVLQFRVLANKAPGPVFQALPVPAPSVERLAQEAARLSGIRSTPTEFRGRSKDWARVIVDRHSAGEHISTYSLRLAREVLNIQTVKTYA